MGPSPPTQATTTTATTTTTTLLLNSSSSPPPSSSLLLSSSKPLERTVATLPLVTGSVAFYLGKKSDEYQTHEWTLYLRGPSNEDLSLVIGKVIFQLHASFAQPTREITEPPYEVTERGWGEFEAQIRIHWKDPLEKTTMMTHPIKLYAEGDPPNPHPTDTETPVVLEIYDEAVFTDPSESFFRLLQKVGPAPPIAYSQEKFFKAYSDTDDVQVLLEAQRFLQQELTDVKDRLRIVDADLAVVDDALRQIQEQPHRATPTAASSVSLSRTRTAPSVPSSLSANQTHNNNNNSNSSARGTGANATAAPKAKASRPSGRPPSTTTKTSSSTGAATSPKSTNVVAPPATKKAKTANISSVAAAITSSSMATNNSS